MSQSNDISRNAAFSTTKDLRGSTFSAGVFYVEFKPIGGFFIYSTFEISQDILLYLARQDPPWIS